jgi:hypothetical protein
MIVSSGLADGHRARDPVQYGVERRASAVPSPRRARAGIPPAALCAMPVLHAGMIRVSGRAVRVYMGKQTEEIQ